jgi:CheY-like chemotaxis protein
MRILAVDDKIETRAMMKEMLSAVGFHRVETARDGEDAWRRFVLNPAALVVTDLEMTPVDGLQLSRLIRMAPDSPNRYVPVVVLSCNTDSDTVQAARDAGVNDFLAKPLSIDTLYNHLEMLITRPQKFVQSKTYFGPDRRLHRPAPRTAERRRAESEPIVHRVSADIAAAARMQARRLQERIRPDHPPFPMDVDGR